MQALITGANGLIGANLARALLAEGVAVRALTRSGSDKRALDGLPVEHVSGDILRAAGELAPLMDGCELVFHAAARFALDSARGAELEHTAVAGTANVIEAAALARVRRVVVTSSSVVFGSSPLPHVRNEDSTQDDAFVEPPYVTAKTRQHQETIALGRRFGVEVLLACPTMSVGPHGTALGPSNAIIVSYLRDPMRLTYPGGCNIASVRDVARGHWDIAQHGQPGESYILGGENLRWTDIHAMVSSLCGVAAPRLVLNHSAAYLAATCDEVRAALTGKEALGSREQSRMIGRYYWYDHARAGRLGYASRPARAALAEACAWLASSAHIDREVRTTMRLADEVHAARRSAGLSGRAA